MPDIIHLLPDSVANQIAAGEVIQRPASAIKELMENSIDAGASRVNVIVKSSGKILLEVIDDGCGMSETDARLSFERHSTSKISNAKDLMSVRTLGFRGEALASVAAVAQVELKTKRVEDDLGTCIEIEGSKVKNQYPCSCQNGTSIAVKNLFFNVPARRNFLKSDPAEMRHIIEEFQRVALIHPDIAFTLHHNNQLVFQLDKTHPKGRIAGIMGNQYSERLVPVEEKTDIISIRGFIGKPQFARKTRGEQYFFVNKRFIRHGYLHHAIESAFEEVIAKNSFPAYFISFDVDPATIDVNIHPTKTEINFQNQQIIYAVLRSAVKKALGIHSLTPSIDFDVEQSIRFEPFSSDRPVVQPKITVNPDYNPFEEQTGEERRAKSEEKPGGDAQAQKIIEHDWSEEDDTIAGKIIFQISNTYIVTIIKSGLLVVDQKAAHQRILYEQFMQWLNLNQGASQQLLYPQTVKFSPIDTEVIKEILTEIRILGFDINEFGKNTFIVEGVPAGLEIKDTNAFLENLIENYKNRQTDIAMDKKTHVARSMAKQASIGSGRRLTQEEMNNLIDKLFSCSTPDITPDGLPTFLIVSMEEMEKRLKKI